MGSGMKKSALFIALGGIIAVIAGLAVAFPRFGFSPIMLFSKSHGLEDDATFFNVPLVCDAAPHLGCGSRAKFIMLDLMKDAAVKEAWLNREGTVMAAVWNSSADAPSRQAVVKSVFSQHELPIDIVKEADRKGIGESFSKKEGWYRGSDVDALSIEEAGFIADQIIAALNKSRALTKKEDQDALHQDIKSVFQRCFLSIKSFHELNDTTYHRIEHEVIAAGEKYVGRGNMPGLRLLEEDCCEPSSDKADCCPKDKQR